MRPFFKKTHDRLVCITLVLVSSSVLALTPPESIIFDIDDPMQVDSQIRSAQQLSLQNTFPELTLIQSVPLEGYTTGRLMVPSSNIIASLSDSYFDSPTSIASMVHADEKSVS